MVVKSQSAESRIMYVGWLVVIFSFFHYFIGVENEEELVSLGELLQAA